jgi:multisubunit Na+/H+ antiporter MnhB subunit
MDGCTETLATILLLLSLSSSISARNRHKAVSQSIFSRDTVPTQNRGKLLEYVYGSDLCVHIQASIKAGVERSASCPSITISRQELYKVLDCSAQSRSTGSLPTGVVVVGVVVGLVAVVHLPPDIAIASCCQNPSFGSILGRRCWVNVGLIPKSYYGTA